MSTIGVAAGGSSLASWSYGRLAGGRLVSQTATGVGPSNSWSYDPGFQLASQSAGPAQTYGYDVDGNPTSLAGVTQSFSVAGELTGTGYGFDDNGNRTAAPGGISLGYDANGALTAATGTGGSSAYRYAADGLRVSKTTGAGTTNYTWDDTAQVPEPIGDGADYYLYGPDGLPVERTGADPTVWLHQDATDSVRLTTDATGTVTSTQTFTPWGTQTSHTGTPPSLGYDSQYADPDTGLIYLRNRYYDPGTAQFLTPDPMFALTGERYGYAGNDPINGSDPMGLCFGVCITIIVIITACIESGWCEDGEALLPEEGALGGEVEVAGSEAAGGIEGGPPCAEYGPSEDGGDKGEAAPATPVEMAPGEVSGYTNHGYESAMYPNGHCVNSAAIEDAVANPSKVIRQDDGKFKYIGQNAVVILNKRRCCDDLGKESLRVAKLNPEGGLLREALDLSTEQAMVLRGILQNERRDLLWVLNEGALLTREDAENVVDVLSDEFVANGLLPDDEPNAWGLEVEDILTAVNRCCFT